jgi:hypothetical protein
VNTPTHPLLTTDRRFHILARNVDAFATHKADCAASGRGETCRLYEPSELKYFSLQRGEPGKGEDYECSSPDVRAASAITSDITIVKLLEERASLAAERVRKARLKADGDPQQASLADSLQNAQQVAAIASERATRAREAAAVDVTLPHRTLASLCLGRCHTCNRLGDIKHPNGAGRDDHLRKHCAGNVRSQCTRCNLAQGARSFAEFVEHMSSIARHHPRPPEPDTDGEVVVV